MLSRKHLNTGELALAHGHDNISSKFNITMDDINSLEDYAFDNSSTWFGSYNTGTKVDSEKSFAQEWVNKTDGILYIPLIEVIHSENLFQKDT